jgi:hypothetical protein
LAGAFTAADLPAADFVAASLRAGAEAFFAAVFAAGFLAGAAFEPADLLVVALLAVALGAVALGVVLAIGVTLAFLAAPVPLFRAVLLWDVLLCALPLWALLAFVRLVEVRALADLVTVARRAAGAATFLPRDVLGDTNDLSVRSQDATKPADVKPLAPLL